MKTLRPLIKTVLTVAALWAGLIPTSAMANDGLTAKPSVQAQTSYTIAAKALRSGDYKKACELLEKMVEQEPNIAQYHYTLSMVYGKLGEYPKTWQQLRQTLKLNSNHKEASRDIVKLWQYFDKKGLFNTGVSINRVKSELGKPDHVKTNQDWQGWRYSFWLIEVVDRKVKRVLDVRKIDPKLLLFVDNVEFFVDSNDWIAGQRSGNRYFLKTDYILPPQTPQQWDQLFSSEHFLGASYIPLATWLDHVKQQLLEVDPDISWTIVSETTDEAIYEWRSHDAQRQERYTLVRILVGERDIHQLSYSTKAPLPKPSTRQRWLTLLKRARLIKSPLPPVTQPDVLFSFNANPLQSSLP